MRVDASAEGNLNWSHFARYPDICKAPFRKVASLMPNNDKSVLTSDMRKKKQFCD